MAIDDHLDLRRDEVDIPRRISVQAVGHVGSRGRIIAIVALLIRSQAPKSIENRLAVMTQHTGTHRTNCKAAVLIVYHVVPNLSSALKAVDAGVDGLIVEGGEGGGFKNPDDVSTLVLLQGVRERTDVPIIAAGGICDGRGMAAAFALGAEGIQMGTRFVSAAESPVHRNYKQAIIESDDTGTVMLNRKSTPCVRALRTERAKAIDREGSFDRAIFKSVKEVYFGGDMEASLALAGQTVGLIHEVLPVAEIISRTVDGFHEIRKAQGERSRTGAF